MARAWTMAWLARIVACGVAACSAGPDGNGDASTHGGDTGIRTDSTLADGAHLDVPIVVDDTSNPLDGTAGDTPPDDRASYCMGSGPPVMVGDDDAGVPGGTCAGAIAARLFTHAVCSCTNANVAGYFRTRSFSSTMDPTLIAEGGPVGLDATYTSGGDTDIGGSFTVDGAAAVAFAGYLAIGGDLMMNAGFNIIGYVTIHRDAWIEGNISALAAFMVGRDLHQPSGRTPPIFPTVHGSTVHTPFTVSPPCDCAPADLLDIAGIVADARTHNDNATVSLDTTALSAVAGIGVDITLPCGRFYQESIGGLGQITLHVQGRTALFIGGDVNAIGAFNVDIGASGELDLFIGGNLLSIGAGSFGTRTRPAATRIYVGGSSDVTLIGASGFVGNVYAPHARITAVGDTTVYGSLFGRLIDMPGYLEVHFDRAVIDVGTGCPMTPPPTCTQCGGTCTGHGACVGGTCGSCHSDGDCCAPLVCYPDGACQELIG